MGIKTWYLIGSSIGHSRSPKMWNGFFAEFDLPYRYELMDITEKDLPAALAALRDEEHTLGANVTMPFKSWAHHLADERDQWAETAGTTNVLQSINGKFVSGNTDIQGIVETLATHPSIELGLVLGAGGAARAAVGAMVHLGVPHISVTSRNQDAAEALRQDLGLSADALHYVPWESRQAAAEAADAIVNATPLGMAIMKQNPLPDFQPKSTLRILDAVYRDEPTELELWCAEHDVPYGTGFRFLYAQGVALSQYFTGGNVDITRVQNFLKEILDNKLGTWIS